MVAMLGKVIGVELVEEMCLGATTGGKKPRRMLGEGTFDRSEVLTEEQPLRKKRMVMGEEESGSGGKGRRLREVSA
jgi:hypothetical protein